MSLMYDHSKVVVSVHLVAATMLATIISVDIQYVHFNHHHHTVDLSLSPSSVAIVPLARDILFAMLLLLGYGGVV